MGSISEPSRNGGSDEKEIPRKAGLRRVQELWIQTRYDSFSVQVDPPIYYQLEGAFWKERGPGAEDNSYPVRIVTPKETTNV